MTDLAVSREREAFEEKTGRALALLRKKDAKIRELGEAVGRRRKPAQVVRGGAGGRGGGRGDAVDGNGPGGGVDTARVSGGAFDGGGNESRAVRRLEEYVEEQSEQIEALLAEVRKRWTRGGGVTNS